MVSVKPKVTEGIYYIFISERELMLLSCSRSDVNSKTEFFEIDNSPFVRCRRFARKNLAISQKI